MNQSFLLRTCLNFLLVVLAGCGPRADRSARPSGTLEVDETRVGSRYGGRVERVLAREGDALTSGQVIIELAADELTARRAQAAAVLAELEAGPRREEIATALAEWEAQEADLKLARADRQRALDLFADKTIAASERDHAVSRAETVEKIVAAAKARYELLRAGTRPERLAQARAQLAEIDTQLREMTIIAPTNAVLEVLSVKPGDLLAPNREAATLLLTNHLWVRVYVPPAWLGQLKLGQPVTLHPDASPDREFHGVIEQIGRAAEFTPRNAQTPADRAQQVFGIKVRIENPDGQLRAGMSVEVGFQTPPDPNVNPR